MPDSSRRARQLFALALETPGGLKVQTVHAFCTSLLHLFPFEANVAARFNVLDETAETQLLDELTMRVLLDAAASPDGPLGRALARAITAAADIFFRELVREMIRRRDGAHRLDQFGGRRRDRRCAALPKPRRRSVRQRGCRHRRLVQQIAARANQNGRPSPPRWRAARRTTAAGSALVTSLARLDGAKRVATFLEIFCTKDLSPRKNLVTKAIIRTATLTCSIGSRPSSRVSATSSPGAVPSPRARPHRSPGHDRQRRDLPLWRRENRRCLLDYDDLIDKAQDLLNNVASAWVHYKLDRGIDYILIDEAQDTSPKQWAIVSKLAEEFFSGIGAHPPAAHDLCRGR